MTHYIHAAEARPDVFMKRTYEPKMDESRSRLAKLVNCSRDELVYVTNATMGVNAVLRGLNGWWKKGEAILVFSTVYGACGKSAEYIVDSNADLNLKVVNVNIKYPMNNEEFLHSLRQTLEQSKADGVTIKIAILDAISSVPGVLVPWEEAVKLLREYQVLSLVDGAHAVGQIPLDLKKADPDFFISNCHVSVHEGKRLEGQN